MTISDQMRLLINETSKAPGYLFTGALPPVLKALDSVMGYVETDDLARARKDLERLLGERKKIDSKIGDLGRDILDELDALFDDNFDPDTGVALDQARKAVKDLVGLK